MKRLLIGASLLALLALLKKKAAETDEVPAVTLEQKSTRVVSFFKAL